MACDSYLLRSLPPVRAPVKIRCLGIRAQSGLQFRSGPATFKITVNMHLQSQTKEKSDLNGADHERQCFPRYPEAVPASSLFVSCLIPAYNEGANIGRVLEVVSKLSFLDEIIVLDDGSSDNTAEVVCLYQKKNNAIKLMTSKANCGKTLITRKGIEACRGDIVVMLDSDLLNLKPDNVFKLVSAVKAEACDLAILDRAGDRKAVWGWTDCARFFGGERAFRKHDFLQIDFPDQGGFLLEIIMNLNFIRRNKKIKTIFCDNLFTMHDHHKKGFRAGFRHYWQIGWEILAFAGLVDFVRQFYRIEEDRLARLYGWHARNYLRPLTVFLIPAAGFVYGWLTFLKLNFLESRRIKAIRDDGRCPG